MYIPAAAQMIKAERSNQQIILHPLDSREERTMQGREEDGERCEGEGATRER